MKVSIITAFYKGNQYMAAYMDMIRQNQQHLKKEDELEVVIVNDSPEEVVRLPENLPDSNVWVYNQKKNTGIHGARVRGLKECTGDYVMFLDQDDLLAEDAIARHIQAVKQWQKDMEKIHQNMPEQIRQTDLIQTRNHPVTVSNALLEQKESQALWYRSDYHKKKIGDYKTYLWVGNQIISPGQCLIPKKFIPRTWMEKLCVKNGADDYYLWLLLLAQHTPFVYVDAALYTHKFTDQNLSANQSKMDDSTYEFVDYLRESDLVDDKDLDLLVKTVKYKDAFRGGNLVQKLTASLQHPRIFIANFIFKKKSKTPYGFNRG